MKWQQPTWVGFFVTTLLVVPFLLVGCPKRPEIAETTPKAIGPQGAIAMPGPTLPPPPTVSAVPPTVPAPDEKSPTEVAAAQAEEAEKAPDAGIQEADAPQGTLTASEPGTGEADVKSRAEVKESELNPEDPSATMEPEAKPEPPGSEAQGADVGAVPGLTTPSAAEPVAAPPVAGAAVEQPSSFPPGAVAQAPKAPELTVKDIYFDFDQAAIRDDSKKTMTENAQWLKANPAAKVAIEGHCDERGSSEYNLALGERRARVARDFLVAAGIETNRISTISFGKERPFVLGHDESAWKWNRRAHFSLSTK